RPVGRGVDELAARARLRHVELQAGAAGAVTAEALVRREKLSVRGRFVALGPDAVVGLGWHRVFLDLGAVGRAAERPEDAREDVVVLRIVAGALLVRGGRALDALLLALPRRIEKEV